MLFGEDDQAFRILADTLDETFWLTGADGNAVLYVSPAYVRIWQQAGTDLIRQPRSWLAAIHAVDRPPIEQAFDDYLSSPHGKIFDHPFRLARPDGGVRWIHARIVPVTQDAAPCHLVIARDVTELRQAQETLSDSNEKLLRLTQYQETINEAQRTRIAREIHDELGQALTVLNLDLYWLVKRCPPDGQVQAKLREMRDLVERTARSVQDITLRLRPANLGAFGLEGALNWYISRFRQQNEELTCRPTIKLEGIQIDHDSSIALYRILQEALTNISRHARARAVSVEISHDHDAILLAVEDDGVGISEQDMLRNDAWGLIGMRERVDALRGDFNITSRPGGGTRLAVRLPLPGGPEGDGSGNFRNE
ncbi:MAG: ATP-binding protein [Gammaproteobacteria bacterium]